MNIMYHSIAYRFWDFVWLRIAGHGSHLDHYVWNRRWYHHNWLVRN